MVAGSVTIPLITVQVGSQTFGPSVVASAVPPPATVTIDRTLPGGLNSLGTDTILTISIETSVDLGATFQSECACTTAGGPTINAHTGLPYTQNILSTGALRSHVSHIQTTISVDGPSPVVISGSAIAG